MRPGTFGTLLAGTLILAACGEKPTKPQDLPEPALKSVPGIALSDARVQMPVVQGRPGVAYFTVSQSSGAPRKIVGVSVELAGRTEMHQSMASGGMASMKPLKEIALEPGKTLKFEPGGNHVMLFDIDPKLRFQKRVRLGLGLDDGSSVEAEAEVTTVMEQPS